MDTYAIAFRVTLAGTLIRCLFHSRLGFVCRRGAALQVPADLRASNEGEGASQFATGVLPGLYAQQCLECEAIRHIWQLC